MKDGEISGILRMILGANEPMMRGNLNQIVGR